MKNSFTFILFLLPAFFYAQNNPSPAQMRLMAKRAAQLDGYRQLAEQVKGMRISSSTTVRDFVTESDQISTALDTVLKGARVVATRYSNDGVCEVDVEMDMNQLVAELTSMSNNYPTSSGRRYDFNQMHSYYNAPVVRATGTGTANGPVPFNNNNAELESLRTQYYQLLAENEQLANQLSALQTDYQQLQGNMARLASMESERQSLSNQLAQAQNAYNKLAQDYRNLEARLGDLNRLQNESNQLRNEANQLRNQLKQAQNDLARERQMTAGQLAQLQEQNALLQQDNGALSSRNKQLQAELEMTRSQGQKAIQDAQSMRNQIASLQKELDAARYQTQQSAQEANQLRNQLAQLQNSLQGMNQLRQENNTLRNQLASAQRDSAEWKARLDQSNQLMAQLQQENQALRQENEDLKYQIEELQSQLRTQPINSDAWNTVSPQAKLMAQRAAQLDAYRNMAETIKGIKIDSQTTVQDFVAESDVINAALDTFIKGIRVTGTQYLPDLTVEVTVEVTLEQVVEELKKIRKRYYQGGRWHEETFNQIRQYERKKIVQAKGSGTVR